MTILFVTPYLRERGQKPKGGGLEAYLFRVAGALKDMGHTPVILALGTRNTYYIENGIEIYFVQYKYKHFCKTGNKCLNLVYNRILLSLAVNQKIRDIEKGRKIDIIQFPSVLGVACCYFGKTPAVLRLSSYAKLYYVEYPFSKIEYQLWILFEKLGAMRCNAVFGPSQFIADAFSKDIHREVTVIESPFWDDSAGYDDSIYRERLLGKKYVLFIGRLHIEKGVLIIAEMIERFLRQHPDHYFVCCGNDGVIDGKSVAHILHKAAGPYGKRFIYIPGLSHEMLYPIIEQADFVICPSLCENLSNACIEAMYFKRVVIATDGTSFEQIIDDGQSGLLCRPGDADGLLERMNEAANMSEHQKTVMGRKARKRIERLDPQIVVKKLLRYYQYVIDHVHC